jgi:hypothetical protein
MTLAGTLALLFFVGPVLILVGVVGLLWCVGKMAAGERIRWPWSK